MAQALARVLSAAGSAEQRISVVQAVVPDGVGKVVLRVTRAPLAVGGLGGTAQFGMSDVTTRSYSIPVAASAEHGALRGVVLQGSQVLDGQGGLVITVGDDVVRSGSGGVQVTVNFN